MGTPFTVALVLLAILVGAGFALDSGEPERGAARPCDPATPIATLEARVEAIRGLRFRTPPKPAEVSPAQAQRDGLEDLDRSYPAAQRRADEEVLKLLGLLEPDVDLRDVSASIFGQGVAGYYDPRTQAAADRHAARRPRTALLERDHARPRAHARARGPALRARPRATPPAPTTPRSPASRSSRARATAVMFTYAERHFSAEQTLGGLFA